MKRPLNAPSASAVLLGHTVELNTSRLPCMILYVWADEPSFTLRLLVFYGRKNTFFDERCSPEKTPSLLFHGSSSWCRLTMTDVIVSGYWNTFSCRIKSFRFTYGYYIVCMVECGETFRDYCTCPGWQRQGCLHLAWLQTSEQPPTSLKCHFFFKGNLFVLRSEKRQEKNLGLLSVAFFVCKRKLQDFIYCSTKRPSGLSLFIPSVHLQLINLRLWSIVHSLKLYMAVVWWEVSLPVEWVIFVIKQLCFTQGRLNSGNIIDFNPKDALFLNRWDTCVW